MIYPDLHTETLEILAKWPQFKCSKIDGLEDYYVTTYGDVFSSKGIELRKLIPQEQRKGYLTVSLSSNNIKKTISVHRLVAMSFVSNRNEGDVINHIDGNKKNNCSNNLEWVTPAYNQFHSYKNNLHPRGSKQMDAKLKEEDIPNIVERIYSGEYMTDIAKDYNVSFSTISNIKRFRVWYHVLTDEHIEKLNSRKSKIKIYDNYYIRESNGTTYRNKDCKKCTYAVGEIYVSNKGRIRYKKYIKDFEFTNGNSKSKDMAYKKAIDFVTNLKAGPK